MSREIKRVPLDFDWPIGRVWDGYICEYDSHKCPACRAGWSGAYWAISEHVNRLMWDTDNLRKYPEYAKLTEWLCGRSGLRSGLGHDSMDAWAAVDKLATLANLPDDWERCPVCNGSGLAPGYKELADAWEKTEPPEGDGWQVWETVSDGSPVSPVFATSEELVAWLMAQGTSETAARNFIESKWCPSALVVDGRWYEGIESCAAPGKKGSASGD